MLVQPWLPNIAFHGDFGRGLGLVGCAREVLYQIVPEHNMLGTWFAPQRTCAVDVLPTWLGFKERSCVLFSASLFLLYIRIYIYIFVCLCICGSVDKALDIISNNNILISGSVRGIGSEIFGWSDID